MLSLTLTPRSLPPLFSSQFPHTFSPTKRPSLSLKPSRSISRSSTITNSRAQTIEHVVLFKVKPDTEPHKIESMLSGLNGLSGLNRVLHLTAGPVHRVASPDLTFTHVLHSRYASKSDLAEYSASPEHVSVVRASVLPICEDIMAVDWVDDEFDGPMGLESGSAIRVTFLKPRVEGMGEEVLKVLREVKGEFGESETITSGLNFSPERAKGFSIATLAGFRGVEEMRAVDSGKFLEHGRDLFNGVLVVDYVVP